MIKAFLILILIEGAIFYLGLVLVLILYALGDQKARKQLRTAAVAVSIAGIWAFVYTGIYLVENGFPF